jgi:hypothetical protein
MLRNRDLGKTDSASFINNLADLYGYTQGMNVATYIVIKTHV